MSDQPLNLDGDVVRFAKRVVNDQRYRANLLVRAQEGNLPSGVEQMIWYYAAGKPAESIKHRFPDGVPGDLTTLSREQLVERAERLRRLIDELPEEDSPSDDPTVH